MTPTADNSASSAVAVPAYDFHVYSPRLARVARILPWGVIAFTVGVLLFAHSDAMFISGLIAAALAAVLVSLLDPQVGSAVGAISSRRIVALHGSPDEATSDFTAFLREFHRSLNSRWSLTLALLFAVAAIPQFILALPSAATPALLAAGDFGALVSLLGGWSASAVASLALLAVLGAVLGLLAWRLAIVGVYIYRLGGRFELRVQTQHPDGAGGLAPLGQVCFLSALILIVPSIFLGVWRTFIATEPSVRARYGYLGDWFGTLLVVTFVLGVIAFLAPLYGVHRAMERERIRRQAELDQISNAMDVLDRRIRAAAQLGEPKTVEELKQQHSVLSEVYKREADIPTWPVDTRIIRSYAVTQVIPFLSLTRVTDAIAGKLFGTS